MEDLNSKQIICENNNLLRYRHNSNQKNQLNILTRNRSRSYVKRNIMQNNIQSLSPSKQKDRYDLYKKQQLTQKFQNLQINLIPKTEKKPLKLKLDRFNKQNKFIMSKQIDKITKNIDKKIQDHNQMVKRSLQKMQRLMTISLKKIQEKSKQKLQHKLKILRNNHNPNYKNDNININRIENTNQNTMINKNMANTMSNTMAMSNTNTNTMVNNNYNTIDNTMASSNPITNTMEKKMSNTNDDFNPMANTMCNSNHNTVVNSDQIKNSNSLANSNLAQNNCSMKNSNIVSNNNISNIPNHFKSNQKKDSIINICVDNKRISGTPNLILLRQRQTKSNFYNNNNQYVQDNYDHQTQNNNQFLYQQQQQQSSQNYQQQQQLQQYQQQQSQDFNQKQTVKDCLHHKRIILQTESQQQIIEQNNEYFDQKNNNEQIIKIDQFMNISNNINKNVYKKKINRKNSTDMELKKNYTKQNMNKKINITNYMKNSNNIKISSTNSNNIIGNINTSNMKNSNNNNSDMKNSNNNSNMISNSNSNNLYQTNGLNQAPYINPTAKNHLTIKIQENRPSQILSLSPEQKQVLRRLSILQQEQMLRGRLKLSEQLNSQYLQSIQKLTLENTMIKQQKQQYLKQNLKIKKDLNEMQIQYLQKIEMYNQLKLDSQGGQNKQNLIISGNKINRTSSVIEHQKNDNKVQANSIKQLVSQIRALLIQIQSLQKQLQNQRANSSLLSQKLQKLQQLSSKKYKLQNTQNKSIYPENIFNMDNKIKTSHIIKKLKTKTHKVVNIKSKSKSKNKSSVDSGKSQVSINKQLKKNNQNEKNQLQNQILQMMSQNKNISKKNVICKSKKNIEINIFKTFDKQNQIKEKSLNKIKTNNNKSMSNSNSKKNINITALRQQKVQSEVDKTLKTTQKAQKITKNLLRNNQCRQISICLQPCQQNNYLRPLVNKKNQIVQIQQYEIQQTVSNLQKSTTNNRKQQLKDDIIKRLKQQKLSIIKHKNGNFYDRQSQNSQINKFLNAVDYMIQRKNSISPNIYQIEQKQLTKKVHNKLIFYSNLKFNQLTIIRETISLKFQAFKYTFEIFQNQMILWPMGNAGYDDLKIILLQYPFFLQQNTIDTILQYCNMTINDTICVDIFCNKLKQFVGEYEQITEQEQLILEKKIYKRWNYTKQQVLDTFCRHQNGLDEINREKFQEILLEFKYEEKEIHHLLCQSVAISSDVQHIKYREYFQNFLSRK